MTAILAIETSSHVGSVCVLNDGVAYAEFIRDDAKLSGWILPAVDRMLTQATLGMTELSAIAFGHGPGSFTGVRTACATAQALAYANTIPLYAVGTLDALAKVAFSPNPNFNRAFQRFYIILDARMNEAYRLVINRNQPESSISSSVDLVPWSDLTLSADASAYAGSGAVFIEARDGLPQDDYDALCQRTEDAESRWAEGVARLALAQIQQGRAPINPLAAEPYYVRNRVAQTEAERAALKAQAA